MSKKIELTVYQGSHLVRIDSSIPMPSCVFTGGDVSVSSNPTVILSTSDRAIRESFGQSIAAIEGVDSFQIRRYSANIQVGKFFDPEKVARQIVDLINKLISIEVETNVVIYEPGNDAE